MRSKYMVEKKKTGKWWWDYQQWIKRIEEEGKKTTGDWLEGKAVEEICKLSPNHYYIRYSIPQSIS